MHFGREVVIPFALAVLLSFLLTYPVTWLERVRLGRVPSVVLVLVVTFGALGTMVWIGTEELADIIIRLPSYQENIQRKLQAVRSPAGSGLAKAAASLSQITKELSPSAAAANKAKNSASQANNTGEGPASAPVPVEIVKPQPTIFDSLGLIGGSLARIVATAGAVVILTLFMLLRRSDLRNRLFRLFGKGRINIMTAALDDAATRVSRYLMTQSAVNGSYGLLLGFGLWAIGVPYAAFWGFCAAFLRFIPYVGTLIAGACPFLLSLAVFQGWTRPLLTLGVFLVIELTISSLVEPWLYATRTGISSLAILVSAAFWTMMWGPIGLVLSTPLTVLLLVIGRHVPQLEFLYILLGDEPVLTPEAHYYQRLLAMDEDEARDVVDEFLQHNTLLQLYDTVLLPAMALAEQDRHEGLLDEERQRFIFRSTAELVEEFGERVLPDADTQPVPPDAADHPILCIPARDESDEIAARMLTQVLDQNGYHAQSIASGFVEDMLEKVNNCKPDVLFISALPPFAISHARSLCRRARKRCPKTRVVVALWSSTADPNTVRQRLGPECSDYVIHTIAEALLQLRLMFGPEPPVSPITTTTVQEPSEQVAATPQSAR